MKKLFVLLLVGILSYSCQKKDPVIPNEEELITTLIYTLSSGSQVVEFKFQDIDGDGGNAPVIVAGTLKANTTYTGSIKLLNELETPADNITNEVEDESLAHQLFYTFDGANATVSYKDQDAGGNPIGITTELQTGSPSQGKLTITLRHQPDKTGEGVSQGILTNAGGETDIEVTFDLNIE